VYIFSALWRFPCVREKATVSLFVLLTSAMGIWMSVDVRTDVHALMSL
jgi:hypothetical protein